MKKKQKWDPHMKVYCSSTKDEQELDFFLQDKNNVHFLFRHPYRRSTYVFYHNGVILETLEEFSLMSGNYIKAAKWRTLYNETIQQIIT